MAEENNNAGTADTNVQTNNVQSNQQSTETQQIDYGKIESMISKGTQQKESAILKSYFEQQGMTEDEAKQAINSYKADKATRAEQEKNAYATMQQENAQLKAQILEGKINSRASIIATEMGIDAKAVPYMLKMVDTSKAVNEKGEVADEAIKTAFEQLLKDVPGIKNTSTASNGFVIGGNNDAGDAGSNENELREMFGLKLTK